MRKGEFLVVEMVIRLCFVEPKTCAKNNRTLNGPVEEANFVVEPLVAEDAEVVEIVLVEAELETIPFVPKPCSWTICW